MIFTHGIFETSNLTLRLMVERGLRSASSHRHGRASLLLFVDSGLLSRMPDLPHRLDAYVAEHADILAWSGEPDVMPEWGRHAQDQNAVSRIQELVLDEGLREQDVVLAVGGKTLMERVGFALGTLSCKPLYIQAPSMAVDQAYAALGDTHFIGFGRREACLSVHCPPLAVINDADFLGLHTLVQRQDAAAGLLHYAVTHDGELLDAMEARADVLKAGEIEALAEIVNCCAESHLSKLSQTWDKNPKTRGCKEAAAGEEVLSFGHWLASELLTLPGVAISKGQALLAGIAVDSHYSYAKGMLDSANLYRVFTALDSFGYRQAMPDLALFAAEEFDRFVVELLAQNQVGKRTVKSPQKIGLKALGETVTMGELDIDTLRRSIDAVITVSGTARSPSGAREVDEDEFQESA